MKILRIRRGFEADHSSSTYEFFSFGELSTSQRNAINTLTGEEPDEHLHLHYMGDMRDIPSDWPHQLLSMGYEVLVSESYDWWTVEVSLPYDPDLDEHLQLYECESDANGFSYEHVGELMILTFGMQFDYGEAYDRLGQELAEALADLFYRARQALMRGDLSVPWAVCERYTSPEDAPAPIGAMSRDAQTLLAIMVDEW